MAYLPMSQLDAMYFVNEARKEKKINRSKWVFKKLAIFNDFLKLEFQFIMFRYDNAKDVQKQ